MDVRLLVASFHIRLVGLKPSNLPERLYHLRITVVCTITLYHIICTCINLIQLYGLLTDFTGFPFSAAQLFARSSYSVA